MPRSSFLSIGALSVLSLLTTSDVSAARSSDLAFVQPRGRVARRTTFQQHRYAADDSLPSKSTSKDLSKSSLQINNIHAENEWGIPHHSTLDPLGPVGHSKPPDTLPNGGRVTLVGSGPGDPDLLTMAAYKLLTQDPNALVISDRLVSQEILDLIPGEIKIARKLPGCAELAQEEIYYWCHEGLKAGKHVIRLKIGDPFVFGRGGEEILTFRDFGVEAKVIPVSYFLWLSILGISFCVPSVNFLILEFSLTGCFVGIFCTSPGRYSCYTSRSCPAGCHVHWLRTRGNIA